MLPHIENLSDYAIFLDLDGTLSEIADRPDEARVEPATLMMLQALQEKSGHALAILSGREITEIDRLLYPLILPVAGVHGLQRRAADGVVHLGPSADISPITGLLENVIGGEQGVMIERKPGSVALHYRLRPELERRCNDFMLAAIGNRSDVRLLRGKMVFEITQQGCDKGNAIDAFLTEPPFCGRKPLFAGDDVTDEAGFAVVNNRGGVSIKIGDDQPSVALFNAGGVHEFHAWLRESLGGVPGDGADE